MAYLTWTSGTGSVSHYQINLMSSTGVTSVGSPDTWKSVRLSPDGNKIVFTLTSVVNGDQIGVMNADGTGKTMLTTSGWNNFPVLTPDGAKILYQSYSGNTNDLTLMNADGTNPVDLIHQDGTNYWNPVISPDGKTIAAVVYDPAMLLSALATMNIDGSGFKIIRGGFFWWPAFSADGSKIFVTEQNSSAIAPHIDVINLDGTNETVLTTGYDDECPMVVGNKVVFMSMRDSQTHSDSDYEIYEMNSDGSGIARLTNNTVYDGFWGYRSF